MNGCQKGKDGKESKISSSYKGEEVESYYHPEGIWHINDDDDDDDDDH